MNTSETNNKSDINFNSVAWNTREELEELIKLAPTAIYRQVLRKQLMAMKEDLPSSKQEDDPVAETVAEPVNAPIERDDTEASDTRVSDTGVDDIEVKEAPLSNRQANAQAGSQDSTVAQVAPEPAEQNDTVVNAVPISTERHDTVAEAADNPTDEADDNAVPEAVNGAIEQDHVTIEEVYPSKRDDAAVKDMHISVERDNVTVETADVSLGQFDDIAAKKTDPPMEEEDILLEEEKRSGRFYVSMRRKSRFTPTKLVLSITVVLLATAASLVFLVRPDMFTTDAEMPAATAESKVQIYIDTAVEQTQGLRNNTQSAYEQIKAMIFGDSPADVSPPLAETTAPQTALPQVTTPATATPEATAAKSTPLENTPADATPSTTTPPEAALTTLSASRDAVFKMHEAKGIALDAILQFDDFIENNGIPRPQQATDIKRQLQLAKSQQQYGQYRAATATYRQVGAELQSLMNVTRQLMDKKDAATLARLHWESYRWQFHRDSQNLPLTSAESGLVDLAAATSEVTRQGAVQRAIIGYEDIERQYSALLDSVAEVARARASVQTIRRQWQQFRDQHNLEDNLGGKAIADITQSYRSGLKFEAAGDFSKAIDRYKIVADHHRKALEKGRSMVDQ